MHFRENSLKLDFSTRLTFSQKLLNNKVPTGFGEGILSTLV